MRKSISILMFLSALSACSFCQSYKIDPGHTSIQIKVKRFGVVNVIGRFAEVSGSITFDPEDVQKTTADVTIKVDSYLANNSGGEEAVKSPAFLDAKAYPEILFKSNGAFEKEGQRYLKGDLTIHGMTNSVELPFKIVGPKPDLPTKKMSIGIESSLQINRQDYGISFDRTLPSGDAIVGNDVSIELTVLALSE